MNFDGTVIHLTPQAKNRFHVVDHWKLAYDACMLLRDMDGLRFLATIPEEVFEKIQQPGKHSTWPITASWRISSTAAKIPAC